MSNELRDAAREALAAIAADIDESAVTVRSGDVTVTGTRAVRMRTSNDDVMGELGFNTNSVRVSAELPAPKKGGTLIVNGLKVWCVVCRTDPAGAMHVIEYSEQQIAQD